MTSETPQNLAGIQYMGEAGSSADCKDAVIRLIQFGDHLKHARVMSCNGNHALLFTTDIGHLIAIKSGFASGYGGEGPAAFSFVLSLLDAHEVEIDEVEVSEDMLTRLDESGLTTRDLDAVNTTKLVRPRRIVDYIRERDWERSHSGEAWSEFPPVVPFTIVDLRIADIVREFWSDPDGRLLSAWRRLEDLVRDRIGSREHGAKLFSVAFMGDRSVLTWYDIDIGEQIGRASVFTGAYAAYRNPRAHRELEHDTTSQLSELLVLNQLFRWENEAANRDI